MVKNLHLILIYCLLNTMSISSTKLYIVADVMLGLVTDRDFSLLALTLDQRGSQQESVELI